MTKPTPKKLILFFFLLFMSGMTLAALPIMTGTYQALAVKYVGTNLPACASTNIVLTITSQCGAVFRGTIKVGADAAIPVTGRLTQFSTASPINITLKGNAAAGIPSASIFSATVNPTTKAISVSGDGFFYTSTTFIVNNLEMNDFVLTKQ